MGKFHIIQGTGKGQSFDLKSGLIYVGRAPDNDIQINDKSISRSHLKILRKDNKYFIVDLKSTNGTFVNNERISSGKEIEVEKGMPIAIGNIFFSLDRVYSGNALPVHDSADFLRDTGETDKIIVSDRPMTTPKNLELIYKVSNVLMQSLDINEILEKILDYIFELLQRIDRGVIILVDNKTGRTLDVIFRCQKSSDDTIMMYSRTIVDRVLREGKAVTMSDTLSVNEADLSESMELMKIRSVMCVPLISRSQTRGVIYVDSVNRPYGFRTEDLALLTALSSPAAIAMENALLYSNLETIVEDKTKTLKETEKMLRESEARFKAIFKNMSSGVIVYEVVDDGEDFVILDLNEAASQIEKIKKKEVLGRRALEAFPVFRGLGLLEVFKKVWETGKPEHRSITLFQDEEVTGYKEYYVYRLPSGEIVSIFDDVTEKKRAEEGQKALQEQLFVSQKMESIGAFAGGTAHNFRNILQAISGNIEYIEMIYGEKQEIKDLAKGVYDSVEKGVDLINNLLHFSKRGGELQLVDLDLTDVIMETHKIIDKVIKKNIEIKLNLKEKLFIKGNRSLLSQVLMNLFTNARDAMPDGGALLIEAEKRRDKVVLRVSDTGHGMDKVTQEKIFDPFFTLKEVGRGTGLGLSTTHGIIEQHNGSISVSSRPGKGTTFKIYLPLTKIDSLQKPESKREILFGKGQKVLIVDDEQPVLDTLTNLTEKLGYKTISVDRPIEALKNYNKWAPDVVLMDRSMPEIDGITCIREIIKNDLKARIIIISGYNESGLDGIDEDIKSLIKGYLTKPCGMEELGLVLSQALAE